MGEHLLHTLIPAADSRAGNVESMKARELHWAVPAIRLRSIRLADSDADCASISNGARHDDSTRETLKSGANCESFVISGADDGAVTSAEERAS